MSRLFAVTTAFAFICHVAAQHVAAQHVAAQHVAAQHVAAQQGRAAEPADAPAAKIDEFVTQNWAAAKVQPAPAALDRDFARRLYVDLVGRTPTLAEMKTFLADGRPNKRELLIDNLLSSEDYVQHFTDLFDAVLMGRGDAGTYGNREKNQWRGWLERVFRENRSWNQVVAEVLLARPETAEDRGSVWFLYERNNNHQAIAEAVAPAFFGIRIECAQCHDHMIASEIEQSHYWGLVAFFNRGKNTNTKNGPGVSESAIGGFSDFANLEGSSSPNLLTFLKAELIDESRPGKDEKQEDVDDLYLAAKLEGDPRVPKFSRRAKFVEGVTKEHPLLARAFVNRMWAMLMGRGIVHPFDEMDSQHDPSHPELLDWLAQDFRDSQYDIRRLVRMIVMSRAYQLDSRPPAGVEDPSLFAWYIERPLTAEQLARSIQLTLRGEFRNDSPLVNQLRQPLPEVLPESINTTVADALFLSNNAALNGFIAESRGEGHLLSQLPEIGSDGERVTLLFETIFSRAPAKTEAERIEQYVKQEAGPEASPDATLEVSADAGRSADRWQQVVWALVTSAEFRFNH